MKAVREVKEEGQCYDKHDHEGEIHPRSISIGGKSETSSSLAGDSQTRRRQVCLDSYSQIHAMFIPH